MEHLLTALQTTGLELLEKARMSAKASDVVTFTEQGLSCLMEAKEMARDLAANSLLLYLECFAILGEDPTFQRYVEFCLRNRLTPLGIDDFNAVLCKISKGTA